MKPLIVAVSLAAGRGKKEAETACVGQPEADRICTYDYKSARERNGKTYGNA